MRKKIHRICRGIFLAGFVNFMLFFLIAALVGDPFGRAEQGQYFFGNIEVPYILFLLSRVYLVSAIAIHILAMFASLVFWATGGWNEPFYVFTNAVKEPPGGRLSYALYKIESLYWRVHDFCSGVSWLLFDSWRRPQVEFFTRLTRDQCIVRLSTAFGHPRLYGMDRSIDGCISGTYFFLLKHPSPYLRMPRPALFGKFLSIQQGTYVRAWHRFEAVGILLLTVSSWVAVSMLIYSFLRDYLASVQLAVEPRAEIVFYVVLLLLLILLWFWWFWFGTWIGRKGNADVGDFLERVLKETFSESNMLTVYRVAR